MTDATRIAPSSFLQDHALPGWRVLQRSLVADFDASNFSAAVSFVQQIGVAADTAAHHPDISIRYPGRVRVTLTTHAVNGLSQVDAELAATISKIAADTGQITTNHFQVSLVEIAIDALDIPAIVPFWKAVLGYIEEPPSAPGNPIDALTDPMRIGPSVWFQQMDVARLQRNRIHLDLLLPHDLVETRISAAIEAGGNLLSSDEAPAFWVLADREGNEICICTWQGRD